jgi:hypothetical protein
MMFAHSSESYSVEFLLPALVITLLLVSFRGAEARPIDYDYSCNICRDPPSGTREVINLGKSFTQSSGRTMTCGELQASVQDILPEGGSPGEARLCVTAQYLAWLYCDCSGPSIPLPTDDYKDPNPACNLCAGRDFDFVPGPNLKKLSDTGCCGRMNCEILYIGAAEGVLSANLCASIQENSGADCCNLETIPDPPAPAPSPPTRDLTCHEVHSPCSKDTGSPGFLPCCRGLECRDRAVEGGTSSVCSAVNKNVKVRITDGDVGGVSRGSRNRNGVRGRT